MSLVVVVPGIMGSQLDGRRFGPFWQRLWLSVPTLAVDLQALALAADGNSPRADAGVQEVRSAGLVIAYYGILVNFLRLLGHQVVPFGYDWRRSVQFNGGVLAGYLNAAYPGRDVVFVAHSLGGIVARAAWKYMVQGGADRVTRLITLGTPHTGSVSIPSLFGHQDPTYGLLRSLVGGPFVSRAGAEALIDDVIGSMVSPYEMMPVRGRFSQAVDNALRNPATYARYNGSLSTGRFTSADDVQTWLADAGDPARTICVVGTGVQTAVGLDPSRLDQPAGYEWSDLGDGRVEVQSAAWTGAQILPVEGALHHAMPYNPKILGCLAGLIGGNIFGRAA